MADETTMQIRPPVAIPTKTGRRPWSTQLLREWASVKFPGQTLPEQVRLGPTSASLSGVSVSPALERALRVWNWYADGLIVLPSEIQIIEAKVQSTPTAIGQVLFYARLVPSTPEMSINLHLPIVPVVLFAESDQAVTNFAHSLGCRVETYTPPWIADYLTQVQFRRRSTLFPGQNLETV